MKRLLPATLAALLTILSCSKADNTPRLVIITLDGLRWQELYSGADESLMGSNKYWRETPAERREALMPFIWQYVPEHGYMIGNRSKESYMQVSNTMNFSYPGYSEMFCGWADDERITSNNPVPNPNVSVLEVAWKDPRYNGSLSMYSSWESVRYAVNSERAGFPASSAHEPSFTNTYVTRMLEDRASATASAWTSSLMEWPWKRSGRAIPKSFMWHLETLTNLPTKDSMTIIWKQPTGPTDS